MTTRLLADELAEIHGGFALSEASGVTARVTGNKLFMKSPYNKDIVPKLGRNGLGGKFVKATKEWSFGLNQLPDVRSLYKQTYGSAGLDGASKAEVKLDMDVYTSMDLPLDDLYDSGSRTTSVWVLGFRLATLNTVESDAQPIPTDGVTVVKGNFRVEVIADTKLIRFEKGTHILLPSMGLAAVATEASQYMRDKGTLDVGILIFGEDEGGVFDPSSADQQATTSAALTAKVVQPTPARSGFDMDTLDGTSKGRAKEMDDMLGAAAFRMLNGGIPQGMIDRLLAAHGLARN